MKQFSILLLVFLFPLLVLAQPDSKFRSITVESNGIMREIPSSPNTPSAGYQKWFFKSDGLYVRNSGGVDTGPMGPTGAANSTNVPWGATVYLDSVNGNDTTAARGNAAKPFLSFTNAWGALQNGDMLTVRPGIYWTRTNTVPLCNVGTNYMFMDVGATLIFGQTGDDTTEPTRPLWTDKNGATQLYIWGFGNIYVSNKTARVITITNAASKIHITANKVWRANTNVGTAVFFQQSGDFSCDVQYLRNDGYDGLWNSGFTGAAGKFNIKVDECEVVDTALECSTTMVAGGGYAEFGIIRFLNSTDANLGQILRLADNVYCKVGTVDLGTNGFITGGFSGDANAAGVLEAGKIVASATHRRPMISASTMAIRNTVLYSTANADPIFIVGDGITLVNSVVRGGATNSLRSNNPQTVRLNNVGLELPYNENLTVVGISTRTNRINIPETTDGNPPRPPTNSVELFVVDFGDNISRFGWIDDNNATNIFSFGSPSAGQAIVRRNNVWTNETVSGSGDVTAAAVIADEAVTRGDGGAKGIQGSNLRINDSGDLYFVKATTNLTSVTSNTVVNYGTGLTIGRSTNGTTLTQTNDIQIYGASGTFAAIELKATTSGSFSISPTTATMQTNQLNPNIVAPAAGQLLGIVAVGQAGGTNVLQGTNYGVTDGWGVQMSTLSGTLKATFTNALTLMATNATTYQADFTGGTPLVQTADFMRTNVTIQLTNPIVGRVMTFNFAGDGNAVDRTVTVSTNGLTGNWPISWGWNSPTNGATAFTVTNNLRAEMSILVLSNRFSAFHSPMR